MNYRSAMSKGNFSKWVDQQRDVELAGGVEEVESLSLLGQLGAIQDSFAGQMFELAETLPDAPLNAAFRMRVTHAIYLLGVSVAFGILAIFIGLPTLIMRPAKFVVCMSLSTLSAAASVIILQKPSVFFSSLLKGGIVNAMPVVMMMSSLFFTIYATIVIHQYIVVIFAGAIQLLCMAFYLASFIPGGSRGLLVLLRMGYAVLSTAMKPCLFVVKKSAGSLLRTLMS